MQDKYEQVMQEYKEEKQALIDEVLNEFDGYLKAIRISIKSRLPHKRGSLGFIRDRILDYSKLVAEGNLDPETARGIVIHILKHG